MPNHNYELVKASLSYADGALDIFKKGLSPTSLESLAKHIAKHAIAMSMSEPDIMDLISVILGLVHQAYLRERSPSILKG